MTADLEELSLGDLDAAEASLRASLCRDDYFEFVKEFWECVPGITPYVHNWHVELYCLELQTAVDRVIAGLPRLYDLAVNVPFGTSKSTIFSVLLQPWAWSKAPWLRFIYATHTDSLATDLAGKSMDVIESDKYRAFYPHVRIRRDKRAKDDYANTLGGERKSCTVGGKTPTGRHAHILGVDDPLDPQGARSPADLDTAAKFMTEVLPSRMVDKLVALTMLVQQRLDPRDTTKVMVDVARHPDATPVRHICLPGELTDGAAEVFPPLEELRARWPQAYLDNLLDPARLSRTVLANYRAKLGQFAYSGQVLQNPAPRGGGRFQAPWFNRRARAAPREAARVVYVDRAATQAGGCATAMVLMARDPGGTLYVEEVVKGHWEPNERNDRIVAFARRCRARYGPRHEPAIVIEAERGSTGLESFQRIAARLIGHRVMEDRPSGPKDVRAEPWADQLAAGNVVICDGGQSETGLPAPWDVEGYVQEHLLFQPDLTSKRLGGLKDQVDASSGACNWLATHQASPPPEIRLVPFRAGEKLTHPRLVVCPKHLLADLHADQRSLLVLFNDPGEAPALPEHALLNLAEHQHLAFADLDPADHQHSWEALVGPWGKPAAELIASRELLKPLWRFLLKQRSPAPEVWVFADGGDRRAESAARAVCDVLRVPKNTVHDCRPDSPWQADGAAPNKHVYDVVKAARGLVVG